jgi:hypothetical protein
MADQGPLVRVDTDGKGNLLKLTRRQADEFVATHAGAKIVATPERTNVDEVPTLHVEGETDGEVFGLSKMTRPELVAFANSKGVDSSGTKAEIMPRIQAALKAEDDAKAAAATDANANGNAGAGANTSENSPEA